MASPVLYGIGTPRFEIKTGIVNFEIVASSTATSVTIKGLSDLSALDANIFLVGRIITTNNTNGQETRGVITSYNDTSKTLNVAAGWTNGNPGADQNIIIADFQIDLPLCEVFTMEPELDFITRKLYNGNKDNYKRGFYQNWVLDYSGYIKAQTLQLLRPLYSVQ